MGADVMVNRTINFFKHFSKLPTLFGVEIHGIYVKGSLGNTLDILIPLFWKNKNSGMCLQYYPL